MRTASTVFVAGSLLVFASCSSSQNGNGNGGYGASTNPNGATGNQGASANGASANGATSNSGSSNGASNTGASNTGASNTGATSGSGTGATGNNTGGGSGTGCAFGNSCTAQGSYCVSGNIMCQCSNGQWSLCSVASGTGGVPGSGGLPASGGISTGASSAGGTGNSGTGASNTGATSGSGTSGSGTGATASGTGGGACASADSQAKPVPPVLFFMIDSTGSMGDVPQSGSTGGQTKWAALRGVWPSVIQGMPSTWAVGLALWSCPTANCPNGTGYQPTTYPFATVPLGILNSTQVASLINLPNTQVGGYTPTQCAYAYALQQVKNWVAPPAFAKSPRYIVMLTDGVPTVNSDCRTLGVLDAGPHPISETEYQNVISAVAAGTAAGIQTFVAGVPGSDEPQGAPYDPMYMLSLVAQAGGTAKTTCTPTQGTVCNTVSTCGNYGTVNPRGTYCHYDLTQSTNFAADLQAAIGNIAAQLVSCSYPFPTPPAGWAMVSTNQIGVSLTTSATGTATLNEAPNDDCAQGGEWFLKTDAGGNPTEIDLCPNTCASAQADLSASVSVHFTCIGEK
jgi:hypothetical protein